MISLTYDIGTYFICLGVHVEGDPMSMRKDVAKTFLRARFV